MRTIAPSSSYIHLPLFEWADPHRATLPAARLTRYRVNSRLEVTPLWNEARHG